MRRFVWFVVIYMAVQAVSRLIMLAEPTILILSTRALAIQVMVGILVMVWGIAILAKTECEG